MIPQQPSKPINFAKMNTAIFQTVRRFTSYDK